MTNLEKEEFKNVCKDNCIEDISEEQIEKLLNIQEERELHPDVANRDTLFDRMKEIIFPEEKKK